MIESQSTFKRELPYMPHFDRLGNDTSEDRADCQAWEGTTAQRESRYYLEEDELTGYDEHLRDSQGCGDARRCPRHPHVKTSSDDGLHDADCGQCEYEGEEAYQEQQDAEELSAMPQWMKCMTLHHLIRCEADHKSGSLFCSHQVQPECCTDPIPF